jgi:hypothetical protein
MMSTTLTPTPTPVLRVRKKNAETRKMKIINTMKQMIMTMMTIQLKKMRQ